MSLRKKLLHIYKEKLQDAENILVFVGNSLKEIEDKYKGDYTDIGLNAQHAQYLTQRTNIELSINLYKEFINNVEKQK